MKHCENENIFQLNKSITSLSGKAIEIPQTTTVKSKHESNEKELNTAFCKQLCCVFF